MIRCYLGAGFLGLKVLVDGGISFLVLLTGILDGWDCVSPEADFGLGGGSEFGVGSMLFGFVAALALVLGAVLLWQSDLALTVCGSGSGG